MKGNGIIRYPDMKLWQEILLLQHFCESKYVVENVISYYKPLIEPVTFCRHFFWANFLLPHKEIKDPTTGMIGKGATMNQLCRVLDVDASKITIFKGDQIKRRQLLRNMVCPELGKHILDCAIGAEIKTEELSLF